MPTVWIAAPPSFNDDTMRVQTLIGEVVTLLQPLGAKLLRTDEPREYRLTTEGIAALNEAVEAHAVSYIETVSDLPQEDRAFFTLFSHSIPILSTKILLGIDPKSYPDHSPVPSRIAEFVRRWFVATNAASGFLSHDEPIWAQHEFGSSLMDWPDVRRYIPGVFWGNALGPDLCNHLGGRERVLREAPVFFAEPLGDGVWLQLSPVAEIESSRLDQLRAYLAPLLDWTRNDIMQRDPAYLPTVHRGPPPPLTLPNATLVGKAGVTTPMEILEGQWDRDDLMEITFNAYVPDLPTADQIDAVIATVNVWAREGQRSEFGEQRFRNFCTPSVNGRALRWSVEIPSDAYEPAIQSLRERLAAIPNVNVVKLVLGTETVG